MRRNLLILSAAFILFTGAGAFALSGCDDGETDTPTETPIINNERIKFSEQTNPYAEYGWEELPQITDWEKKLTDDPVYYEFEGIHTDAFMMYPDRYIYMNCYEDGGLYATVDGQAYYGYWTNVDATGRQKLVLHLLNYNGKEYNNGEYDVECKTLEDDYYEYYVNFYWAPYSYSSYNECIGASGVHYSPVKSLTLSKGLKKFTVGDNFSAGDLSVTLTRENGKSMEYENFRSGSRFTFEGFDGSKEGVCEISVGYFGTEIKAKYDCTVYGITQIDIENINGVPYFYVDDSVGFYYPLSVWATRRDGERVKIDVKRCTVEGLDLSCSGEKEITVTYNPTGQKAKYKYTVYDITGVEFDFGGAVKQYIIGDTLDLRGVYVKVTYEDGYSRNCSHDCKVSGFDPTVSTEKQTITLSYRGYEGSYDIKISPDEFTGYSRFGNKSLEVVIKLLSYNLCEYSYEGNTYLLNCTTREVKGKTICTLLSPADDGMDEQTFKSLRKSYFLDRKDHSHVYSDTIFEIPSDYYGPGSSRFEQEPVEGVECHSYDRYIKLDEQKGEATLTYSYGDEKTYVDKFVCKYKFENGVLTFTGLVEMKLGNSGASFEKLCKTWVLNKDGTMTKYVPSAQ